MDLSHRVVQECGQNESRLRQGVVCTFALIYGCAKMSGETEEGKAEVSITKRGERGIMLIQRGWVVVGTTPHQSTTTKTEK